MAKYEVKEIRNKNTWEQFVLSRKPKSFLQSWNWGETNKLMGKKIFRLGFYAGKRLIGVCLAIKEEARRGHHLIIPGGPFIEWSKRPPVNIFIKTIKDLAQVENTLFVRARPEILDSNKSRKLLMGLGFISAPMHLHAENTWVLDIIPGEEKILRGMRKSTRYLIKKSLKMNLTFEEMTNNKGSKLLKKLQDEAIKRHKFAGFPEKLFRAQIESFGEDNQAKLYVCSLGKIPLVASIIIFYGDYAYYHHSGSSKKAREVPASYFMQWKIIQESKKRGCQYYNLWGIAPNDNPNHRFAGVTLFKKGFGGERLDWLHAVDLPTHSLYWITYFFETVRRVARRL